MGSNACKCVHNTKEHNEDLLIADEIRVFNKDPQEDRKREEDTKFLDKNRQMHFNRVLTEQSFQAYGEKSLGDSIYKRSLDKYKQTPITEDKSMLKKQISFNASITPIKQKYTKCVDEMRIKEYPLVKAIFNPDIVKEHHIHKIECNYLKGKLNKFHPGFALSYVSRECKVTRDYFEYYSDAVRYLKLPLTRLWTKEIEAVLKVNVQSSEFKVDAPYQFEIIMKPTWDPKRSHIYKDIKLNIEERGRNRSFSKNTSMNSFCGTVDTHLMKRAELLDKFKNDICNQEKQTKLFKVYKIDGVRFNNKDEARSYKKFLNENKAKLTRTANIEIITVKNPKKWIKSLSSSHTWSNRELEWYLAEQRMLFSAQSLKECNRWIILLNWLLQSQ